MTSPRRVVVATASYGGGHEEIAAALIEELRSRGSGSVRVADVDLLERCAPRSAQLARVAYGGGEEFLPAGTGTVRQMAGADPHHPVLRELLGTGVDSAASVLGALAPDLVIAVHPVAGAIAAEAAPRLGCAVAAIVSDLGDGPVWAHPACDLYFVATAEARDSLVLRGVDYTSVVVSGIPVRPPVMPRDGRAELGLEDRFTAALVNGGRPDASAIAGELSARGVQVVATSESAGEDRGGRRASRPVRIVAPSTRLADLAVVSDVIVTGPCGAAQWVAPSCGTPMIVVEPVPATERVSVEVLVHSGAALAARDAEDAARTALYLMRHAERVHSMRVDAGRLLRPGAARVIVERALAHIA